LLCWDLIFDKKQTVIHNPFQWAPSHYSTEAFTVGKEKDFEQKISETAIRTHRKRMGLTDLKEIIKKGGVAIVLITTYHFYKSRAPHWVVVTAYDEGFVYIHDPDQEWDHDTVISRVHVPIPEDQFMKISRWGKSKSAATVVVYQ
jgi:hypothetical protein